MNKSFLVKDIVILAKIEKNFDVVSLFKYKDFSSWVAVKDALSTNLRKDGNPPEMVFPKKDLFSKEAFYLIFISTVNYVKNVLNRKPRSLFIGAGSGLFENEKQVLDSYFPYKEESTNDVIYFLNADYSKRLFKYKKHICKHNITIFSFIFSPLTFFLARIIFFFQKKKNISFDNIIQFLKREGFNIKIETLIWAHIKYISGYLLYFIVLRPLKINKVYVVSSYSNSDIIAVCKKRGIEIIEMQHGVVGETHRGYNYKLKDKRLPTPDMIYVYNSFWTKELLDAGFYSEKQIKEYGRLKYKLLEEQNFEIEEKYIVFTGQNLHNDEIKEFLKTSNQLLIDNSIRMFYIPHPNESQKAIDALQTYFAHCNSVVIIKEKKFSTEKYILDSIAHISLFSSCHFDAIHFKGITYIADIIDNNPMEYYVQEMDSRFIKINTITEIFKNI